MERREFLKLMGLVGGGLLLDLPLALAAEEIDPTKVSATLRAAGGTVGGIGYVQMTAFAKIVEETYPKIKMNIVPGAWIGNIFRTNKGELDIGSSTLVMCRLAKEQKGPFTEPLPNVRALMNVQDDAFYFAIVRKDLPADSVGEIVRKKVPARLFTLSRGNATEWIWRMAFQELGATWDDLSKWGGKMIHGAWADGVNLVKDGHADGILAVGGYQIGWLTELASVRDLKWLQWDMDLYQTMVKKYGFLPNKKLPAGSFRGQTDDVLAPADSGVFVVQKDLSKEVVYTIVKALAENEAKFQNFHALLKGFKASLMGKNTGLPLHEGAMLLYKEKGFPIG